MKMLKEKCEKCGKIYSKDVEDTTSPQVLRGYDGLYCFCGGKTYPVEKK